MAEAIVVASNHAEERRVTACLLRSRALNLPRVVVTWFNLLIEHNWVCLEIVPVGADKESVLRPGSITIVADNPRLREVLASLHWVPVVERLLDKAALILNELLIFSLLLNFLFDNRLRFLLNLELNYLLLYLLPILTHQLNRCLPRPPYLQHGMWLANLRFTLVAKVEILAHSALVSDAHDRGGSAVVTGYASVFYLGLFGSFLRYVVLEEAAKS